MHTRLYMHMLEYTSLIYHVLADSSTCLTGRIVARDFNFPILQGLITCNSLNIVQVGNTTEDTGLESRGLTAFSRRSQH